MNPLSCCAGSPCEFGVSGETAADLTSESIQRLLAGVEIGLRIAELTADYSPEPRITSPQVAMRYCLQQFGRLARESKQEEFHLVTLDTKNQPIDAHQITVGTLRNSLVHPRESVSTGNPGRRQLHSGGA